LPWFKVDDAFWAHPKTLQLSTAAVALWVRAGSWSSQQLTDGRIANHVLPVFAIDPAAPGELVDAGYWHEVEGGYAFHDWDHYQPSAIETKTKRDEISRKRAEAGRKGAESRWQTDSKPYGKPIATPEWHLPSEPDSKPIAPSRPVPSLSSTKKEAASRGSRVDPQFAITPAMREWAKVNAPLVNLDLRLGEWIDYWASVAGAKGVKSDWVAAWRNGMRKQQEFAVADQAKVTTAKKKVDWMNQ
jgi:hypothetical protein